MPGLHDVCIVLIVCALAMAYGITVSIWLSPIADFSRRDLRERAGFAIVGGVLLRP